MTPAAFAQATWTGATSSDWFDRGNWDTGAIPDASTGVIVDGGPVLLGRPGASIKTLSGTGVIDLGTQTLTITGGAAPAVEGVFSGSILGAGGLALTSGAQRLLDVDTGSTTVTVTGQGLSIYDDAVLDLYGMSSAGTGTFSVSDAGFIGFHDTSTAANAAFAVGEKGVLGFTDTADAGSSHIAVNSGGVLVFDLESAANGATVANTANGAVDVSLTGAFTGSDEQIAIGSLAGAGDTYLGGSRLTVGALNRNDTISGIVTDGMSANMQAYFGAPVILTGGALVKTGTGTLTLAGANTYTGGTTIDTGTVQLGDGGASGSILGDVTNNAILAFNRSDSLSFGGTLSGTGGLRQIGSGMTRLSADNSGLTRASQVLAGTLSVDGILGGTMAVHGGRLQGIGQVGATENFGNGIIAPGNSIGTLTIAGDYAGSGGRLEIEAELGGDTSPSDRLTITGDSSGATGIKVLNVGGAGAPTAQGIKIVDIGGASTGSFDLLGDYVFEGEQAVVGGAYAYRLYKNGVSTPLDGDWYLRSTLSPAGPGPTLLFQPGVPVYEAYANVLQGFNALGTLQQRVGDRSWASTAGIWGRIEATHGSFDPKTSTSGTHYDLDIWKLQAGADTPLYEDKTGSLIGGLSARYGTVSADIASVFGHGTINSTGYGLGATLTWYGSTGFYLDGQAEITWYDSDLSSSTAGLALVDGNDGFGSGLSLEAGQKIALGPNWSITPQAQLAYSAVEIDNFSDVFGAGVSLDHGASLKGRLGLSLDYQNEWQDEAGQTSQAHVYGIANLYYDALEGAQTDVAGTRLTNENDPFWGGIGIGGSHTWGDDKYSLRGEVSMNTSLADFGDSYALKGNIGFRVKF